MHQVPTQEEFNALVQRIEVLERSQRKYEPLALEWVTLEQAGVLLNRCKQVVSKMCKAGRLEYKQESRKIEVKLSSIRKYLESHHVKVIN